MMDVGKSITMQRAHSLFGHIGEEATRKTSMFGIKVTGTMEMCDACALAKGKQKNETATIASKPGERLLIDNSLVSAVIIGGIKFMVMIVNDYSRMKWCQFVKSKSELTLVVMPLVKELQSIGKAVINIQLDNAG